MLNLLGEYPSTLDSKSRVLLPAALKKQLGGEEAKGFVVNRDVFSECLVLYPMDEWNKTSATVRVLNRFDPDNVEFIRRFLNGATRVDLDVNGRLLIPKPLMDYASMAKDVVFTGMGDRIELWSEELHKRALSGNVDFKSLAAKVMGGSPKTNGA
ncbi:MAG TPA: division/cell wall cluster transcriptional repressor MraZ [Flavobacteriales bacterium]|jgi:MraZ protein|nr:division/cell wall cluster transcriptional repressor MraZ [Flavobacteriales bacterium]MCC6912005.1 division/cell wall cluster transcriptional repressor MraZ [Flavobacteriales bacterium]HQW05965.1 division/cell wall cluster transcriptional repressor MraZ [Flavobacteriales bacterium]HQW98941.1 division/cell wall cluster transcriptional repressor MraZ [Flavobacteriales bacterium]